MEEARRGPEEARKRPASEGGPAQEPPGGAPLLQSAKPAESRRKRLFEVGCPLKPAREPPERGGGGPQGRDGKKPSGLGSLNIPLPWEVPEGPACMVPVA